MNPTWIITVFVIVDELLAKGGQRDHVLAQVTDAEVLTVALVAAKYFHNNHERALLLLQETHYLSGELSVSRFNRRLHRLADWLELALAVLGEVAARVQVFIIDSLPVPVCKRVRARRCHKVRGRDYCGYCAAKKEKFFGWRLHLIRTPEGVPVSFAHWPAGYHDLTPVHELAFLLPPQASLYGDKGYLAGDDAATILKETQVRLITVRRKNVEPNTWGDDMDLRRYRKTIETRNSQLEKMGLEHLHARTNTGFEIKVHASLLALFWTNIN